MKALLTLILLVPLLALANGHDQDPNAPHDMGPPPGHDGERPDGAPDMGPPPGHDQDPNAPHNMGDPNAPHDMGPPPGHDQDPNAPHDMGPPPGHDPDDQQEHLMGPVDNAAEAAFEGALSNGASSEEAFEAGRVAAEEAAVEAGMSLEEIQEMTEAARKDFDQGLMGPPDDQP